MIKYIFWDFDGTIADSLNLAIEVTNLLAKKYNLKQVDMSKIDYYKGLTIFELIKEFNLNILNIPKLAIEFKRLIRERVNELELIPNLNEVILKISEYAMQGILTSNSKQNVKIFLENHSLANYFCCIFSERQFMGKEFSLRKILRKMKISRSEIIYIGDEYRDIIAAKRVGIKSIAVLWGFNSLKALKKASPTFFAQEPNHIISIIKKLYNESTNSSNR